MILTEAQKAAALEAVADADGDIAIDRVWKAAKKKSNPLHGLFPWDLKKAAIEHWRSVARRVVRSVKYEVVFRTVKFEVPRYVRNPSKPNNQQSYRPVFKVRNSRSESMLVIEAELARIESLIRRGRGLAQAFGLSDVFEDRLENLLNEDTEMEEVD